MKRGIVALLTLMTLAGCGPREVRYDNCDQAREAGVAPLHSGSPGYRSELDRDGDGTACD